MIIVVGMIGLDNFYIVDCVITKDEDFFFPRGGGGGFERFEFCSL